ncbi:MAG: magnesium transporter CorA family protein [Verrucomicrobiia bacterium]
MLQFFDIIDGRLLPVEPGRGQVLVYTAPDEQEKKELIEHFEIDEHTLNSALDPNELARVEFEEEHTALIVKRPKKYESDDNFHFKVTSIGLFLFADRLVCVLSEDVPIIEGRKAGVRSLHEVLLKCISCSIHHFQEHLRVISMISDQLEGEISKAMENRNLLHMFTIEKSLVYYLNAMSSNGRLIEKLKAYAAKMAFNEDNLEFLDDITIENAQCHEQAKVYSQVLSGLMDARASVVSNNLNVIMKTLTLVTIGIMAPNLVVSIFSMNVALPVPESGLFPFWFILSLCLISVGAVYVLKKIKKW